MIRDSNLPKYFWADTVSTTCYVRNPVTIRPILKKTPYEFGCKCFVINNDKDNLGKFDEKSDEGVFLGYSITSKTYKIYNKRTLVIEESMHVSFDEYNPKKEDKVFYDDIINVLIEDNIKDDQEDNLLLCQINMFICFFKKYQRYMLFVFLIMSD